MRLDKFIGTACMLSIYGRKYDVIFKYVEIIFIGADRIHAEYHNHNKLATNFHVQVS